MLLPSKIPSGAQSPVVRYTFFLITLPAILIFIIQLYHTQRYYPAVPDFLRTLLWNLWFVSPLYLGLLFFSNSSSQIKFARFFLLAAFLFYFPLALINIGHMLLFRCHASFLSISAILQTDANEIRNFGQEYFSPIIVISLTLFIAIYSGFFCYFWKRINYTQINNRNHTYDIFKFIVIISIFFIMPIITVIKNNEGIEKNSLLRSNFTWRTLIEINKAFKNKYFLAKMTQKASLPVDFGHVTLLDKSSLHTYVVILGEGASRHHMSLYGYPRKTSASLDKLAEQLIIYDNVVSMFGTTFPSLNASFLFHSIPQKEDCGIASIISLHKAAGFKTFWLTNNLAEHYGKSPAWFNISADVRINRNKATSFTQISSYDADLLPDLASALADPAPHKFIVLHLAGTHPSYSLRYPKDSAVYEDNCTEIPYNKNILSSKKITKINQYDNAITYNNEVIKLFIDMVSRTQGSNYVLTMSDHSQQLYEISDSFGGHVATKGTQYMYDIPFFIWLSPEYKNNNHEFAKNLKQGTHRFWKLDESFSHSIAELSRITFKQFSPEKSLFSHLYQRPDSKLGDGSDYFTLPGPAKRCSLSHP